MAFSSLLRDFNVRSTPAGVNVASRWNARFRVVRALLRGERHRGSPGLPVDLFLKFVNFQVN
jgi:hypothetical protein